MVGQNIGKYRVLDRVGRGGMGTVYRAIDETLHREVAIKVLNAELNDPEVARRFRAEAITVARLSHPGIATIYELFQHDGQWLMVMEFLRGETLEHVVSRIGPLAPERAAELCMQSLAALAHAHSMAVVHRDLKPANIMLTHGGDIKIMDFGIARVSGTEHLTNVGFMMGTPAYMAPEQVMGHEIDARADLYAMGVVLFRLVTGQLPFKGDSPFAMAQAQVNATPAPVSAMRGGLPPWVDQVVSRALAKAPDGRFQSAAEFHDTLQRAIEGAPAPESYRSSAPAGVVSTPPHAVPTHALERDRTGVGPIEAVPAPDFDPAGMAPTMAPTPVMTDRPRAAADLAPLPAARSATAGGSDVPARGSTTINRAVVLSAAGMLILLVVAGAWWMLSPRAAEPPAVDAPDTAVSSVSAEPPADIPLVAPPADPLARDETAAPSVPAASSPTPSPTDAARGTAREGRAAPAGPAGASASDGVDQAPPVEITSARVMVITGRKADDQSVTLVFDTGKLAARREGAEVAAMSYDAVKAVTYIYSRSPRWDRSLAGPPDDLDVGGVFRSSRHWVMLQGADAYLLLRLEDINVIRAIREIEARTGLTVARPSD